MDVLRTADDRFARLPGFALEPSYADVPDGAGGTLRMAWVADGPSDGPPVLLLHGEPTWSFLYRSMIGPLAAAGFRAIAPDLVGFGRSDKPALVEDHTYARHVEWVRALAFDVLDLRGVTLVGQDWGGLIGLRLVAEHPDRFARIVAANTLLPTGDDDMPEVWWRFRRAVEKAGADGTLDVARLVAAGCTRPMADDVRAAYGAPFPDLAHAAGPRAMPLLVPTRPDDPASDANRAAWDVLRTLDTPVLCPFSDSDPITGPMRAVLARGLPGAAGRAHPTIAGAGHFLQEDAGPELAAAVVEFAGRGDR